MYGSGRVFYNEGDYKQKKEIKENRSERRWQIGSGIPEILKFIMANVRILTVRSGEFFWPAYWRVDDCRHNVKFIKNMEFDKDNARFCVHAQGIGHVCIHWKPEEFKGQDVLPYMYKEKKYPFGREIVSPAREISVEIIVGNLEGLPAVYVEGDLESDRSWLVTEYSREPVKAGWNCMYTKPEQNPMVFEYTSQRLEPVCKAAVNGGMLYDFGREVTAETHCGIYWK